jgi:microcystin-dependent protein
MAIVYLGSMMLVPYNFAPLGFAFCNGQLLPISSNTALFSLLGTTYGGDGRSTFALPNLQGSLAVGMGQSPGLSDYVIGDAAGSPNVTLTTATVPPHQHKVNAAKPAANLNAPKSNAMALSASPKIYYNDPALTNMVAMNTGSISPFAGNNQPHNNMMPYLGLQWIMALQGIFPPRS